MSTKVYYGEYSLQHWIDLILTGNITLPEYQRSFVWTKKQAEDFINALKEQSFIPPVTLGNFEQQNNYIIDGQQRLTSILLAYIGKFPKKDKFPKFVDLYADPNDTEIEEDNEPVEWQFKLILSKDNANTRESIRNSIEQKQSEAYENIDFQIESILKETYLGFSFIVPNISSAEQQKFYCSVFRNMNMKGTSLLPQESRRSLYFLDNDKKDFFDSKVFDTYKIINNNRARKIDFIRYASLASQYKKESDYTKLMKYYAPHGKNNKDEEYYAIYISEAIDESKSNLMFKKFSEIFPKNKYLPRLAKLEGILEKLNLEKKYSSIIETDITFFGLVYNVLICNKSIDESKIKELKKEITAKIDDYKKPGIDNDKQLKNPNQVGFLRKRLEASNIIYSKFIK